MPPGSPRVLLHFDVDAFYAQTEEIRNPSLKDRPLAITQKYLCVTSNYHARKLGVQKLMSIKDAKACCPSLTLVSGEDLTPYRQASRSVLLVLSRFGIVEKGGMDEAFVDVTKEAAARVAAGNAQVYHGHVLTGEEALHSDNPHRVMDLRANSRAGEFGAPAPQPVTCGEVEDSWVPLLRAGSAIAAEARAAVKMETGFRTSAGISSNKMLAKLVSGLHKPDDQTVLLPPAAPAFMAQLPVRAIPGIGYKMFHQLQDMGIQTVADLRQVPRKQLVESFGDRLATFMHDAARGQDTAPIKPMQPPKTVTVEDSFKSCSTPAAAAHVIKILTPDLLARLQEEHQEYGRRPTKFILKWRLQGSNWRDGQSRVSSSCPMPPQIVPPYAGPHQAAALEKAAYTLLIRNTTTPFSLSLLNLGATNFVGGGSTPSVASCLMSTTAPAVRPDGETQPSLAPSPSAHGAYAAAAATASRRDYGACPRGAALSKQAERALSEGRSGVASLDIRPANQQPANTPDASQPTSQHQLTEPDSPDEAEADEWAEIRISQQRNTSPPIPPAVAAAASAACTTSTWQDHSVSHVSAPTTDAKISGSLDNQHVSSQLDADLAYAQQLQQEEIQQEAVRRRSNSEAFSKLRAHSSSAANNHKVQTTRKRSLDCASRERSTLHRFFKSSS